jgi:hypothetical protein
MCPDPILLGERWGGVSIVILTTIELYFLFVYIAIGRKYDYLNRDIKYHKVDYFVSLDFNGYVC